MKRNTKILLTDLIDNQYIFYQSSKIAMLVRIYKHTSLAEAKQHNSEIMQQYADEGLPILGSMTIINTDFYLLIAERIFSINMQESEFTAFASTMRRLADWYRYTYLIPLARGEKPIV